MTCFRLEGITPGLLNLVAWSVICNTDLDSIFLRSIATDSFSSFARGIQTIGLGDGF